MAANNIVLQWFKFKQSARLCTGSVYLICHMVNALFMAIVMPKYIIYYLYVHR